MPMHIKDFNPQRTGAFEADGRVRPSWTPPPGSGAAARRLDYVLWPEDSSGLDQGLRPLDDLHAGIDHEPVKLLLHANL